MGLLQQAPKGYRGQYLKGRFYNCISPEYTSELVLVRPLNDSDLSQEIASTITPVGLTYNAFDHEPFESLGLKRDEEFLLTKAKDRKVVALTRPTSIGLIKVAPIYTLKDYHRKEIDVDSLRKNQVEGLIYLEADEFYNKERFISLVKSFTTMVNGLVPVPVELNQKGIDLLDDKLADLYELYSSTSE